MPSNLFVVVFPRRVQAHTVFVDRKEKPRSKWSVGGLRSPPGLLGSTSVELEERRDGEAAAAAAEREDGEQGERKDAGEGEDNDSEAAWHAQLTPKASRKAPPAAMSTPGSKRRLVTEVIGDGDDVDVSRPQDMDEGEKVDIEKLVRGILVEMRGDQLLIGEPTYHTSASGKLMTCIFPCDVEDAHLVLTRLESVGVGSEIGSVNVLPMEIGRSDITRRRRESDERDEDKARRARHNRATGGRFGDASSTGGPADGKGGEKDEDAARRANERFRALASQIRVTQVTEEIREGTKCHFDYMALLVASSAISAMGLATNNVAVVVAAMLVSPIMGPVLAFTFGTNVRDWSLAKKGFLVESFYIDVQEYVMIGLISFALTIVNILSIYVAGVWLFIFKEVAPIKSENSFWSKDMINARKFQQRLGKNGGEGGEAAHMLRKTLLEAANRHKDGASGADSGGLLSGVGDGYSERERKASFSSNTNTHHRYRYKDKRRRPTVFDLFPDMNDNDSGPSEGGDSGNTAAASTPTAGGGGAGGGGGVGGGGRDPLKHAPAGARESLKLETGRLLGLMTNFLVRGDDHKSSDNVANNAGSTRSIRSLRSNDAEQVKPSRAEKGADASG
eukprot:g11283.t1